MTCRISGADLAPAVTDLPFKTGDAEIAIVKGLPVFQCSTCQDYLLSDAVMARVEKSLDPAG